MVTIFYQNKDFISYNVTNSQIGNYYLNIPNYLGKNLQTFQKLHNEDNNKKGISLTTNETNIRKQLLDDIKEVNILIQYFNKGQVYSKNRLMKELPINELEEILKSNIIFNMDKYKELLKKIENIINENYKIMFDPNIRKDSINETLLITLEKESDKDFVNWIKVNLGNRKYDNLHTLEQFRKQYKLENIKLDISNYKEITTEKKEKFIIGKNTKNSYFTVSIPKNMDMNKLFQYELEQIDKTKLLNKDGKEVAKFIFDIMIINYPSKEVKSNKDISLNKEENKESSKEILNELADNQKNVPDFGMTGIYKAKIGSGIYDASGNNNSIEEDYIPIKGGNSNVVPLGNEKERGKVKSLIRKPNNNNGLGTAAFVKVGTVILFAASALLIVGAIVLIVIA